MHHYIEEVVANTQISHTGHAQIFYKGRINIR